MSLVEPEFLHTSGVRGRGRRAFFFHGRVRVDHWGPSLRRHGFELRSRASGSGANYADMPEAGRRNYSRRTERKQRRPQSRIRGFSCPRYSILTCGTNDSGTPESSSPDLRTLESLIMHTRTESPLLPRTNAPREAIEQRQTPATENRRTKQLKWQVFRASTRRKPEIWRNRVGRGLDRMLLGAPLRWFVVVDD